jgi:two-component system chemotaxis response regulator CheY
VGTASSGSEAIEIIRNTHPGAVISAMHLPDINGLQLAEQIQSEFKVQAPGFVLVTSAASESDLARQSQLERVLLLAKPFTAAQLGEALKHVAFPETSSESPTPGKVDRSRLRVLIVDDSTVARINVRTVLQGLGFSQFLEVPDGAHAIAVATREICHLIVTDYNMPLMDGRALVSYLKQNPGTAAIPIIMVTTETDPQVLDPVRQLGVVAVVEKAFPASIVGPLLDKLF